MFFYLPKDLILLMQTQFISTNNLRYSMSILLRPTNKLFSTYLEEIRKILLHTFPVIRPDRYPFSCRQYSFDVHILNVFFIALWRIMQERLTRKKIGGSRYCSNLDMVMFNITYHYQQIIIPYSLLTHSLRQYLQYKFALFSFPRWPKHRSSFPHYAFR
jgi:hypothetical protein